ncbi:phage antirepressor N-terminal domain-containing protein [Pseudomonas putida]
MQEHLLSVPFYEDRIVIVGQGVDPFVAMEPLVTNMGLDWKTQLQKLSEKFNSVLAEIAVTGGDGKQLSMTCLPLRKLPAWLYSISQNDVKPQYSAKIIRYQEECDDVLWDHWSKGGISRSEPSNVPQLIALSRHRVALLKELSRTCDNAIRAAIHEQLALASGQLGLSVPELTSIGSSTPAPSDILIEFWSAIELLDRKGVRYNHCTPSKGLLYLQLPHLAQLFQKHNIQVKFTRELRHAMKESKHPRYVSNTTQHSVIERISLKCWVFQGPLRQEREVYQPIRKSPVRQNMA